jgi:hypothetical protein
VKLGRGPFHARPTAFDAVEQIEHPIQEFVRAPKEKKNADGK